MEILISLYCTVQVHEREHPTDGVLKVIPFRNDMKFVQSCVFVQALERQNIVAKRYLFLARYADTPLPVLALSFCMPCEVRFAGIWPLQAIAALCSMLAESSLFVVLCP